MVKNIIIHSLLFIYSFTNSFKTYLGTGLHYVIWSIHLSIQ